MRTFVVGVILLLAFSMTQAAVINQYLSGIVTAVAVFGQSFTTPSGGPLTSIRFNFYSNVPPTAPNAAGNVWLLTQEYLGTPAGLSPGTPGFLAEAVNTSSTPASPSVRARPTESMKTW